jgi:glyoxylase I family protein
LTSKHEVDGAAVPDETRPPISGLHHLSITVSDLDRSVPWYRDLLGLREVGHQQHADGRTVVLAPEDGSFVILLQEHKAHEGAGFSEHRPGLDHLSFRVDDVETLEAWERRFDERDVSHQPLRHEPYGAVLIFRDPDRIQLELFVDPRDD